MENLRQEKGQGAGHAPSGEPVIKGAAQLASTINQSELAAAMHFLGQTLGAASHYDPSRPDHGRASVVAALVGVNQLIAALFPNKPALPVPLIDLACALKDLDGGIVGPLLQPAEISHRPPKAVGRPFHGLTSGGHDAPYDSGNETRGCRTRDCKAPRKDGV